MSVAAVEVEALAAEGAALEGVAAVDRFVAKPRAASSRSLIALVQGAFGIEDSPERSGAKAIVRADDAEEIPHDRAKGASSRDAALASLAEWPLASVLEMRSAGHLEQSDEFSELSALLDSSLRSE
jgi:hypothetical protein